MLSDSRPRTPVIESSRQRRKIYTEKKAKVVAVSWGIEMLQCLTASAILQQDELKNRLIFTLVLVQISLFFKSSLCNYDLCLLFCIYILLLGQ